MESWNHSFKVEAILGSDSQREQVPCGNFDYIEVFYKPSAAAFFFGLFSA